jgi:enolase
VRYAGPVLDHIRHLCTAPCRSERVAKYNRILQIESEQPDAKYAGLGAFKTSA